MSSSDVTTRKPGSASDWLPWLIYSPSADNLNNFIAKRRAFEENRELTPQELKPFLVYARFGVQNLNPQQVDKEAEMIDVHQT